MRIVIQSKGGSGRGLSYWTQFLREPCPRRISLNAITNGGDFLGEGAWRGVLFHALMESYFTGKLDAGALEGGIDFVDENGQPARQATPKTIFEALVLTRWLVERFGRRDLGTVLGAELSYPSGEDSPVRAALEVALGHRDFTGQSDLVTHIETDTQWAHIDGVFRNAGVPLTLPRRGRIMWDFKTTTDLGNAHKYEYGWQEIAYPWLHFLETGEKIDAFVYFVIAIGRRRVPEPSAEVVVVDPPDDEKIAALIRFLAVCKRARDAIQVDPMAVNRNVCAPKYHNDPWCNHLTEGRCNGY